jgi:hypothetical protein
VHKKKRCTLRFSLGFIVQARQQLQGSFFFFFLAIVSSKRERKRSLVTVVKKKIETNCHRISTKEELVFLSFVFSFGE